MRHSTSHIGRNPRQRTFDRGGVFVKACPMYVDRAHTHAAAEQQPEGWRFVPDTILTGYQWTPQWVPARTPTVHLGPISGKAVGGPNTVQHSSTVRRNTPNISLFFFSSPFFVVHFLFFVSSLFFFVHLFF